MTQSVGERVTLGTDPERDRGHRRWALAARDVGETLLRWRLWTTLAGNDIAQRYRRSKLGQFWITISMALFIAVIGSVYSVLFRLPPSQFLPHVVVYYTTWAFISQSVNEGVSAFIEAERYLRQERLPKFAFIMRVIWRNLLAYLHNLVLVPITFLIFGVVIGIAAFDALVGVAFLLVNTTLTITITAVLCTRFRDLRHVVQNLVQIAFFASPIMWRRDILPEQARFIVDLNPVAAHLRLIGEPLLGQQPDWLAYAMCGTVTLILLVPAVLLFVRFRERIVYWL